MAARAKKASAFNVSTGLSSGDSVMSVANVSSVMNNAIVTIDLLLANSNVPIATVGNNPLSTANLIFTSSTVPSITASTGTVGQMKWDTNFLYVCVSANHWRRVAFSDF